MPKKKKVEKVVEAVEIPEVVQPTEKELLEIRRDELSAHREWMVLNRLQDIGQVEVSLAKAVQRLTEL